MKVRHEINIITGTLSGATAADGNWIIQLDPTKYDGTVTYFFEALYSGAASNTGTIRLRRKGTTTDDAILTGATSATLQLTRSTAFTPPATPTEYIVRNNADGTRSQTIKAARIIIIQDTDSNDMTESQSQYEIGSTELGIVTSLVSTLRGHAAPKYWQYIAANFDGALSFTAEVSWLISSTTGTKTFVIQESSAPEATGSWTTAATIVVSSGTTAIQRSRGGSFIPKNGFYYRLGFMCDSTMPTISIYNAKIIVDQTTQVETAAQKIFSTVTEFPLSNGSVTEVGQAFKAATTGTISSVVFRVNRLGAPTGILTCRLYSATGTLGTDAVADVLLETSTSSINSATMGSGNIEFTFAGTTTLVADTNYVVTMVNSIVGNSSNYVSVVADSAVGYNGNAFYKNPTNQTSTVDLFFIARVMTGSPIGITKLEEHYLLANATLAAGTAVQNFLTRWDTAEYSDATIQTTHAVSAINDSTSVVELVNASAVQLTGSVVSLPDNYKNSQDGLVEDSYVGTTNGSVGTSATGIWQGNGFTAEVGGKLSKVQLSLAKYDGTTVGDVRIRIRDGTGTYGSNFVPNSATINLASSDIIDASTFPIEPTRANVIFNFPEGQNYQFTQGGKYCLMVEYIAAGQPQRILRGTLTPNAHDTNAFFYTTTTEAWTVSVNVGPFVVTSQGPTEITMPSTQNIDVRATTNNGNIYSSRMIAAITENVVPVTPVDRRINTIT